MNPKISPEKAIERVDKYFEETDNLFNKSYQEGSEDLISLEIRIVGFIRSAFNDDNEKIAYFRNPYSKTLKSEEEKQKYYTQKLKK